MTRPALVVLFISVLAVAQPVVSNRRIVNSASYAAPGLPNGSTNWLATSDAEVGQANGILVGSVKWLGVDKQFTDLYSTYSTWVWAYQSTAYRCVWTNELR